MQSTRGAAAGGGGGNVESTAVATGAMGLVAIGGGIMGWLKAASTASLALGSGTGLLLLLAAFLLFTRPRLRAAYLLATVVLVMLAVVMTIRFSMSLKFMPAGLVALLSGAVLAFNLTRPEYRRRVFSF